jgi:hypothetical protein
MVRRRLVSVALTLAPASGIHARMEGATSENCRQRRARGQRLPRMGEP